jgi:acyl-CoA thioesterase FadM
VIEATEQVISERPFVVRRRVRWGECDPAGVVYTGCFTDYLLSAVMLFHEHLLGEQMASWSRDHGVKTPCKAMSLTFKRALWPGEIFLMQASVGEIRNSSYDIEVQAALPDGTPVFEGRFSPVCIPLDERRAVALPEDLRRRLQAAAVAPAGSGALSAEKSD